jgi:hypothetical protein
VVGAEVASKKNVEVLLEVGMSVLAEDSAVEDSPGEGV